MSDKTHCDLCDTVIEPTVRRLTVKAGVWEGDRGVEEDTDSRDVCLPCVKQHPILGRLLINERLALELSLLDAIGREAR